MVRNQHSCKGAPVHSRSTGYMGHHCTGTRVTLYSDNSAVVQCLETKSTKNPNLAHLLCCLFFFLAHHNISYRIFHVADKNNRAADALSRNELWVYSHLFPQAPKSPPCFCRSCWMTQSPGHQIAGETHSEPICERLS